MIERYYLQHEASILRSGGHQRTDAYANLQQKSHQIAEADHAQGH